jgi:hypothetical protein
MCGTDPVGCGGLRLGPGAAVAYKTAVMPRLVFDIETSAVGLEHFDEVQQEYLFREAERQPT